MRLSIEELAKKYNVTLNQEIMEVANESGPEMDAKEKFLKPNRRY